MFLDSRGSYLLNDALILYDPIVNTIPNQKIKNKGVTLFVVSQIYLHLFFFHSDTN